MFWGHVLSHWNAKAEPSETLDLRGLKWPLPAPLVKRQLKRLKPGQSIAAIADDPIAQTDIPHMCLAKNYEVVEARRKGEIARLNLRRP